LSWQLQREETFRKKIRHIKGIVLIWQKICDALHTHFIKYLNIHFLLMLVQVVNLEETSPAIS
jgi:hypothetical protein